MNRVGAGLVLLGTVYATTPSLADEPVPGACPKQGTVLNFDNGVIVTVGSADGLTCNVVSSDGGPIVLVGLLSLKSQKRTPSADEIAAVKSLWPLEVGKSAKFKFRNDSGNSWDETLTVSGKQEVVTKAGTFQTFVVDWVEEGTGYLATYTSYIAPDLSYLVKRKSTVTRGRANGLSNWELVSVKSP